MRILMVTPRFPPLVGGVELHVAEVARRVVQRGHQVTVLTTDRSGRLPVEETRDGVAVERVRAWPRHADYYLAPGVYPRVARGGWDVVHVQSYHTLVAPIAMSAARFAEIPYVVTFHAGGSSSTVRSSLRGAQLALLRPLLARATKLVALTPSEIDDYSRRLRLPRDRFVLVPNGSDLPAPAGARAAGDGPLIASIGRLERYKGHQHVIGALPAILHARPETRLWIAGSGPYRHELEALAARLGVSSRIEFRSVPPDDRAQMADRLSRVDVLVLASDFETYPLAVLEAAAIGCRIVVADAPGLHELGERGLARVVSHAGDHDELARAVLEEMDEPRSPKIVGLSSWDECADQLCEVYASVAT